MINALPPLIPAKWSPEDILFDTLCDQFEDKLIELGSPKIPAFLEQAPPNIRPKLFRELLFLFIQFQESRQTHIPLWDIIEEFPQFEEIVFDVYKCSRPNNMTVINKLLTSETDLPSDATIGIDQSSSTNVREIVQIGKYSVLYHIDSGGQGDVFLARHPTLRKNVVIKLSRTTVALDSTSRDRLVEEGQVLAKLNHRNLVRVIDLDFHEQRPFLVMDHLKGKTVREFSAINPLEPSTAVQWVIDLCYAVSEAHNNSIIHRDIKPANIVIVDGAPTLIDFGLAISTDEDRNSLESGVAGTISYMSPEQTYSNQPKIGPATDVFGLAAVLYFLLENQSPLRAVHPGKNITLQDARQFDGEAISPLVAHHFCGDVLVRALSNDPAQRYDSATQFAEALATSQPRLTSNPAITKRTAILLLTSLLAAGIWSFLTPDPTNSNPEPTTSLEKVDYEVQFNLRQETSNYLHEWDGVRLINEEELGEAKYWMPRTIGEWGFVTYRFPVPFEIGQAKVRAAISIFPEWRNDERFDDEAVARLDVSSDGETWYQIAEVSKQTMQVGLETKLIDISRYVAGGTTIFVRGRLLATKEWLNVGPIFAQFLRSSPDLQHDGQRNWDAFHLQVTQCGE